MRNHKILLLSLSMISFIFCKKSAYIEKSEIESSTGRKVKTIIQKKSFNVDDSKSLENIIYFSNDSGEFLSIFRKEEDKYTLLKTYDFPSGSELIKLMFINPGLSYSHILTLHKTPEKKYSLSIHDSVRFKQQFEVSQGELKSLQVIKNTQTPNDEMLSIQDILYRFDSFRYSESIPEKPLGYLVKVHISGQASYIRLVNRGGYTSRAVITIAFPDLGRGFKNHVSFVKDIATVRLYPPGTSVFRSGGGKTRLPYPTIEIIKEPFSHMKAMHLPLFLNNPGKILIRMVYQYRGGTFSWPDENSRGSDSSAMLEKDAQGFLAYKAP